jgi:hypothetical protein
MDERPTPPVLVSPQLAEHKDRIRTLPLAVGEWAKFYGYCSKTMLVRLREMAADGRAWPFGKRWQILLAEAPESYWIHRGYVDRVLTPELAIEVLDALELKMDAERLRNFA